MVADGLAIYAHDYRRRGRRSTVPVDEALEADPAGPWACSKPTDDGCRLRIGGDLDWMARFLVNLPFAFQVEEPPELRAELRRLGRRLQRDHR